MFVWLTGSSSIALLDKSENSSYDLTILELFSWLTIFVLLEESGVLDHLTVAFEYPFGTDRCVVLLVKVGEISKTKIINSIILYAIVNTR